MFPDPPARLPADRAERTTRDALPVSFWKRKLFWDIVEYVGLFVAAIAGMMVTRAQQEDKDTPALVVCLSAIAAMIGKGCSRFIEDRQKAKKATQDEKERTDRQAELERLRQRYGDQARRMVQAILEDVRAKYFRNDRSTPERHKHRVTLFIYVEPALGSGCGKHLAIFARAGVYENSTCTWAVDDNDPKKCRGLAGHIWFHRVSLGVRVAGCDWPDDQDQVRKAKYAESLGLTAAEAEALNVKSKALTGDLVMVNGRPWGVLLLDSLKDGVIVEKNYENTLLRDYAAHIGAVLERMES